MPHLSKPDIPHLTKASAIDFYADLKAAAVSQGRSADQIVILPSLSAAIASTEAQAHALLDELNGLTEISVTERGTLMLDLDQVAATGISTNFNENILGISAVGARLALPGQRATGVIVLTGPGKYFTKPRVAAMRRDLLKATAVLSNTSLAGRAVTRFLDI